MFFKILFVLAVALEFVFVPLFLKFSWPKKCWKSFGYKMICSALFFAAGLLAMKISGNHTQYATLILWGLFFGWLGDMFLHLITDKIVVFGLGLFAFLGGHIFYIIAFQKAIYKTYPDAGVFKWYEILAVLVLVGSIVLFALKKKINIKTYMAIPVIMYAITISTMLVKAFRYTIGEIGYGMNEHMFMVALTVAIGAVLFVLSDGSLGILLFAGQEKNRPLKIFNIGTYFAAQILLASSLFFVQSPIPLT
ncbi:MAG: lysoplasmalogenase [Faecalibacterium sp.]|nr:lysoplasmalogenase [Ruminococcus sp.]MCM1391140.1 lysoplasmalogenase [Ruminococcus sp.]MCM1486228.1 lysoplasmalogenase [Faecalibacterium sp.]